MIHASRSLRRGAWVAVAAWALLTLALTLRPVTGAAPGAHWIIVGPETYTADAIANIGFFMPLGALLVLSGRRPRDAALTALLLSLGIEVAQGLGIPGRFAALSDLVCNGVGGWIGAVVAAQRQHLLRPRRAAARALLAGWALGAALLLAVTTWLQAPGAPSAAYQGQHARDWNVEHDSAHAVRLARLDGRPFSWGMLPTVNAANAALAAAGLRLDVMVDPGATTPGVRRIAAIIDVDPSRATLVRLESDGRDLRFIVRMRGAAYGLHAPFVRVKDAFPAPAALARPLLELGGARAGSTLAVWVHDGERTESAVQLLTPLDGWQFVVPPVVTARLGPGVLRTGEAMLLFLPLTWWFACFVRATPPGRHADSMAG